MLIAAGIILLTSGCVEKTEPEVEMVLSNYPKLFEKDVIIVVGENATQIEMEGGQAIAENLGNLTGNVPVIKTDVGITDHEKTEYNLILVGRPGANNMLSDVYERTNATKVSIEIPGVGKGVLELLRSPWNEEKAVLLVGGSDEWGVRAGYDTLEQSYELNNSSVVVSYIEETVPMGVDKLEIFTWYNGDRERHIFAALDEIAIFPQNPSEPINISEVIRSFDPQATLIDRSEFMILARLPNRLNVTVIDHKIAEFQNTTGNNANLVFYEGQKKDQFPMGLTGEIIVHFRDDWDDNKIAKWAADMELETIEKFSSSPNTYLFRKGSGIISLELANQIYLSGEVIYAYPNWWKTTSMKPKGPETIPNETKTLIENKN